MGKSGSVISGQAIFFILMTSYFFECSQSLTSILTTLNEIKSYNIGDPSFIGASCESGDVLYCEPDEANDPLPIGCEGVLFFSDANSSCKSLCESDSESNKNKRSVVYKGWTKYFNSFDTPNGTGDHEHYFFYCGDNKRDRLAVYDSNNSKYTGCKKTAIDVRERETGKGWWALGTEYTLLFSKFTHQYVKNPEYEKSKYESRLKPDYG